MAAYYNYEIEETRDSTEVLKVYKDNRWIYIGSRYNYKSEIKKFLSAIGNDIQKNDTIFIFGFATGEHIFELAEKYKDNKIIVVEPNKKMSGYIKQKSDLCKNIAGVLFDINELKVCLKKYINEYNYKNSKYACFCNYGKAYSEEYNDYCRIIKEYLTQLALDVNTKLFFYGTWFNNLINIIPQMIESTPADLYDGKFKNKPAIIVSAGPSLSNNIDLLKKINDKAMIIVSGRTLGAVEEKNINPDLLVIADPKERNYLLIEKYLDNINVPLLFYEGGNLEVIKKYKGLKIFFSYNELIYKIIGRKIKHICTGGSVAHAMTSYAANLGCNPIIFIGQDFAYTNNIVHSDLAETKDGIDEKRRFQFHKKDNDIFIDDINGKKVRTSLVLNDYRKAMEKIIKLYPDTVFINSTEGGAQIDGTKVMPLNCAIDKYCIESFDKIKPLNNYNKNFRKNAICELKLLLKVGNEILSLMVNDNEFKNISQIIKIFNENSVYNLLLYNNVYEYLNTANHKEKSIKDADFYRMIQKSIQHSAKVISDVIEELKNNM